MKKFASENVCDTYDNSCSTSSEAELLELKIKQALNQDDNEDDFVSDKRSRGRRLSEIAKPDDIYKKAVKQSATFGKSVALRDRFYKNLDLKNMFIDSLNNLKELYDNDPDLNSKIEEIKYIIENKNEASTLLEKIKDLETRIQKIDKVADTASKIDPDTVSNSVLEPNNEWVFKKFGDITLNKASRNSAGTVIIDNNGANIYDIATVNFKDQFRKELEKKFSYLEKDKTFKSKLAEESKKALISIISLQLTKAMCATLNNLSSKLLDEESAKRIATFFGSKFGEDFVSLLTGIILFHVDKESMKSGLLLPYSDSEKFIRQVATEMRVSGLAGAGNALLGEIFENIVPSLKTILDETEMVAKSNVDLNDFDVSDEDLLVLLEEDKKDNIRNK
ncbi:MAG: hypothetical protein LC122_11895 [Chitinophagales bacterium]|nr:hypothetical protein [Chitinophagales bacterium]